MLMVNMKMNLNTYKWIVSQHNDYRADVLILIKSLSKANDKVSSMKDSLVFGMNARRSFYVGVFYLECSLRFITRNVERVVNSLFT